MSADTEIDPGSPELVPAREGHGPTLQRDYWAQIRDSQLRPDQVGEFLCQRFAAMVPPEIARFSHMGDSRPPLALGDEMQVWIRFAGECRVRLVHKNANSLTFATLEGHPEAGRITFGAYRHASGNVVFHIRSRARSSNAFHYLGFRTLGRAMQTETWTRFIDRVAATIGRGVVDFIYEETRRCRADGPELDCQPTFLAEGP